MEIHYEEAFKNMLLVLESKKQEFHLYGYPTVTEEAIWTYCVRKVWRNNKVEELATHKMVNDILHISPAAFMTYTQIEAQREGDWFSDVNTDELQMLFESHQEREDYR